MPITPPAAPITPVICYIIILACCIIWALVANRIDDRKQIRKLVLDIVAFDKTGSLSKAEIKAKLDDHRLCPKVDDLTLSSILLELVRKKQIHSSMMCIIVGSNKYEEPVYSQIQLPSPSMLGSGISILP